MSDQKSLIPVQNRPLPSLRGERALNLSSGGLMLLVWVGYIVGQFALLSTVALSVLLFCLWISGFIIFRGVYFLKKMKAKREALIERNRFERKIFEVGIAAEVRQWEQQTAELRQQEEAFSRALGSYLNPTEITYRRFTQAYGQAQEIVRQRLSRAEQLLHFALNHKNQDVKSDIRACLSESQNLLNQLGQMHLQLINTFTQDSAGGEYTTTAQDLDRMIERIKAYTDEPSSI